jgi:hypothetical protein
MNGFMTTSNRALFEHRCFEYYVRLRAANWSAPEEGDGSKESLFWRSATDDRMYGVAQIQAAWQGFQMAAGHFGPIVELFGQCLQKTAVYADLQSGVDVTQQLPEAVRRMRDELDRAERRMRLALLGHP